jgi:predicted MFS family arabinose efflux permease
LAVPIGTALGAATGWRATIWFVAALGAVVALGIIALLPSVPTPPAVGLRRHLTPLARQTPGCSKKAPSTPPGDFKYQQVLPAKRALF